MILTAIKNVLHTLDIENIPKNRKEALQPLINFIQLKVLGKQEIRLNFICTHNSRRSHLAQVWSQTMAPYFNIKNAYCYSGGTEITALSPFVIKTLKNSGFKINTISVGKNPVYSIKYSENEHPVIGFSKIYDDPFNPKSEFIAIMTCSQADEGCPFITGAEKRILLPFEDPKTFDNTSQQTDKYNKISIRIATELFFVFSQIKLQ